MKNILLFLLLFLSACSGEKNTKQAQSTEKTEVIVNEDQSPRDLVSFKRPGINLSNSLLADYQRAKKKHKYLPFCTSTQDGNLFISCNRKFSIEEMNSPKWNKSILFGLTSGKGDTLLPNVFEKIGNAGIYGDGYIEVFKKGKYQLYDYINRRLFEEEFELIFPSMIKGYLAIGKRNGQFFKLYDDGTSRKIENENEYLLEYHMVFFIENNKIQIKRYVIITETNNKMIHPYFFIIDDLIQQIEQDKTMKSEFTEQDIFFVKEGFNNCIPNFLLTIKKQFDSQLPIKKILETNQFLLHVIFIVNSFLFYVPDIINCNVIETLKKQSISDNIYKQFY